MNNDNKEPLGDITNFEKIKFIREEIRFQHNLLGARATLLVTSESFLFTAFAVASRGSQNSQSLDWFLHWLLPCVGLSISLLSIPSILGAINRITGQRELLARYSLEEILCFGDCWDRIVHKSSLGFSGFLPIVFLVAWVVVFCNSTPNS